MKLYHEVSGQKKQSRKYLVRVRVNVRVRVRVRVRE